MKFNDVLWWFKHRILPSQRYHVLRLGIEPGYADVRCRLVYANFALLVEFVEREKPFEHINWDSDPGHAHAAAEIRSLYDWWKNVRPKRESLDPLTHFDPPPSVFVKVPGSSCVEMKSTGTPEQEAAHQAAVVESLRLTELWETEDSENIKRLAAVRLYLWT